MSERRAAIRKTAARYRQASKKKKGQILDEFIELTDYNRKYASWILSSWGKKRYMRIDGELVELVMGQPKKRKRRRRPRIYDESVFKALKKVWYIFDCPCGKRFVPVLRTMLPLLYKFGEVDFDAQVREKLEHISAATIDRLLSKEKKKLRLKSRSHTKPGSLLKHQIPIRTFDGWDDKKPGFVEIDLVGHDGGSSRGDYAFSLNLTDVCTGWTEPQAVRNKARKWTFEALMEIKQLLPFDLLGIDSDNGGEFINFHLIEYCEQNGIEFTRSRPYRKNDNCFVEQKNGDIVRRYVGYGRYDSEEQLSILNEIYQNVRLFVNFFQPSMKLVSRTRRGSKVHKKYDEARTPYQRLVASGLVSELCRARLKRQFDTLNPAELHRQIRRLQAKLYKLSALGQASADESAAGS
jgi:hypothetical protein